MSSQYKKFDFPAINELSLEITYHNPVNFCISNEPSIHTHNSFEIYFNLSGNVSFIANDKIYKISKGNLIITNPYEYHHCIFHDNHEHEHYCMNFSLNSSSTLFKQFTNETGPFVSLPPTVITSVANHFKALVNASPDSELDSLCHFFRILQIIKNNSKNHSEIDSLDDIPDNLRKALKIINTEYQYPITVSSLASELFMSVNTLERYFKRHLNISPKEYIMRKRLSYAIYLLNDNQSISTAAAESGFSDTSNFIQNFKRAYGKTPRQYLRETKN